MRIGRASSPCAAAVSRALNDARRAIDQLLRTPGSTLVDGQRVDLVKPVSLAASSAAGA